MRTLRAIAVDDDADARGLARTLLEQKGYLVEEAAGSAELFAILESRPGPDVILLDLTLVGTSGWQILRALKADPSKADIPVIVVSGRDDDQFRDAAMGMGARGYITKPYRSGELVHAVRNQVRGGHLVDPWAAAVGGNA